MGLGILEDRKLEHVPGTATLEESRVDLDTSQVAATGLKTDKTGRIILVPQPSDDPNDPLNWPIWKRDVILFVLSLLSVIASTLSPLLAATTLTLSLIFERTFTQMALLTGYHLLGVAVAGILFVPSARVWGKRHLYLLGTCVLIFSSAWGGASGTNYKSLLWARIFQGVALAPFEALVNASVGDLYHVHERGKRMALSNLALFGGAFFTPVIVGKITHTMGWSWTFYFIAIFSGALLPCVILFVPETAYARPEYLNIDTATILKRLNANNPQSNSANDMPINTNHNNYYPEKESSPPPTNTGLTNVDGGGQSRLIPYYRTLLPFNGRKTSENYFLLLLRPLPLFAHPGILWACLIQGTLIGWTVMIGIVLAAIMLGPPLFFDEVKTGYMYTGAFVGAIVGFALAGLVADPSAKVLTRWNKGVFEPEFRLVLVVPQLLLGCTGLYGFGIVSNNIERYGWFWPDFFFAFEVAGMVLGAVASALYVVDAHRDIAVEAFTCLMIFKNIFSFGLTFSGFNWLVDNGVRKPFVAIASVQVGICMLSVLMYVFGKKNRSFFARHDILRLLKLR
ncbi:putative MFS transporter [Viridothelium virens]|uniref:Putative MFS transporter n=1 Tax=Viridothelium virens TaxID=1048519 RepID=A0A6A6HJ97_VIRVR|nr:putative MFS transporter [Viridothelium virens]